MPFIIVKKRDVCFQYLPVPHLGVNPWDLHPNHLWQIELLMLQNLANYDICMWQLIPMQGSWWPLCKLRKLPSMWLFEVLFIIISKIKKMDNGSRYISKTFQKIEHKIGITHNPQWPCGMCPWYLENTIWKNEKGELYTHNALNYAQFVLKFLKYGCSWIDFCRDGTRATLLKWNK